MKNYDLMNILGRAFAFGKLDNIDKYISKDCEYISEYANVHIFTAEKIIKRMKSVSSKLRLEDRYTFKLLPIKDIINNKEKYNNDEYAILLYQYNDEYPVAVVSIETDSKTGKITKILLSRNSEIYNVDFYREDMGEDSPLDLPSSLKPLTHNEVHDNRNVLPVQKWVEVSEENNDGLYIWRKADEFMKSFLPEMGYRITESQIFEDCIGYKCLKQNSGYTIYTFAYGRKKTIELDGEYCKKFLDYGFSKNSNVLIVYINIKRYKIGKKIEYEICNYCGHQCLPDFWKVVVVNNKTLLLYCPSKELIDTQFKLMYAFNNECLDVFDCIVVDKNPILDDYKEKGNWLNDAFYFGLQNIHKKYGNMKLGYVRFNDVIYSIVSYIDNYGYFSFRVENDTNRIIELTSYPFEGKNNNVKEFIKSNEREDDLLSEFPKLLEVEPFQPVDTERFALKLFFDNGECKKYVLPINRENEKDEVVRYQRHVFTDKIWQSAIISDDCSPEIKGYSKRLPKVEFKNGFFLSSLQCYFDGTDYSEPELTDDIIYEDEKCILKRIWKWNANDIKIISDNIWVREGRDCYNDSEELEVLKGSILNKSESSNFDLGVIINAYGKRLCTIDYTFIDDFHEGMAIVYKRGIGYGYIDRNLKLVIPIQYEEAEKYLDGFALVKRENTSYLIDKKGNEKEYLYKLNKEKYEEIGDYYEGICKVSLINLEDKLAYHSDTDYIAGIWGFVNEKGEEIVPPQYIFAYDFCDGIAFVCKGKWTNKGRWNNTSKYWREKELWGAIDKDGNEVIPFIFDEIIFFISNEAFIVHYGGWEKGHYGVIDKTGKWLAEPVFEYIDFVFFNGMFAFYEKNPDDCDIYEEPLLGIYDTNQQKVLFEPQFLDVDFFEDGWIKVEVFDEKLGRKIEKLIDKNGNEKFHSEYSHIDRCSENDEVYEVTITTKDEDQLGLIDKDGKVLYPCEYNIKKFFYKEKLIKFNENGNMGLKDFEGNINIPPIYYNIFDIEKPFYTIQKEKDCYNSPKGILTPKGEIIIPTEFENIHWLKDGKHVLCSKKGFCQMLEYIEK